MRRICMAIAVAALVAVPAAGSPRTDVMATVRQFVNSFNRGNAKTAAAACANEAYIIDEFPPHEWHGAGACLEWMNAYVASARETGVTNGKVTLGQARHVDIAGGRAYVVVPANYFYRLKGKPVREIGSMFTVVLQKGRAGWRIVAWCWTKR